MSATRNFYTAPQNEGTRREGAAELFRKRVQVYRDRCDPNEVLREPPYTPRLK